MILKLSRGCTNIFRYKFVTSPQFSTATKSNWDLVSSVCLERKPIITKELSDLEIKFSELLHQIELELSYKSNHEVKMMKEKLITEDLKKGGSSLDRDEGNIQTAQEFEDACTEELNAFKFSSRVTVKDLENDVKSCNRLLSDSLVLVTKQNIGNQDKWIFPQGIHKEGESMRQTAERVLNEVCGKNLQTRFLGNAPCGFYKFRYPRTVNGNNIGMKIFFFKAQLLNGSVSEEVCKDFKWLPSKDLNILHEDYLKCVKSFLIENE